MKCKVESSAARLVILFASSLLASLVGFEAV
jgi:hypothetical protein